MTTIFVEDNDGPPLSIDLREPYFAAFLAWLWPGAGHIYQRRYAKAMIFMVCILGIFFTGLGLGRGRCVYASWKENDKRWQYVLQAGAGLPALPAVVQSIRTRDGSPPFFQLAQRYPADKRISEELWYQQIDPADSANFDGEPIYDGFMAPPAGDIDVNNLDVLGVWNQEMGHRFDIGTLFTIVAGVLNLLVIYDAFAGPAVIRNEQNKDKSRPSDDEGPASDPPKEERAEPPQPRSAKRKSGKTPNS